MMFGCLTCAEDVYEQSALNTERSGGGNGA